MKFKFNKSDFDFIIQYADFGDLESDVTINKNECEITVDDVDNKWFLCSISDISVVYGMDSEQNNITELGANALRIYDEIRATIYNN